MPKPVASNCHICKYKAGPTCSYWKEPIDKIGVSVLESGYTCPSPKSKKKA